MKKTLILKNWRAKLISLLLATTLWYLIKKNVATTLSPFDTPIEATAPGR
jgi:YbbR domain-containing protein